MAAKVDSAGVEADLRGFPERLVTALRPQIRHAEQALRVQAWTDASSMTTRPTGKMVSTLRSKSSVSKAKARISVVFDQPGAPYAAWVTYGLAPRPWRERATSRKGGYLSLKIGKAKVHKPWGIRARGFAQETQSAGESILKAAAEAAVADAVSSFNGGGAR